VRSVALIAGGGRLPLLIAASAVARGEHIHIVAIRGEADAAIAAYPHTWVGWGQIGRMLETIRREGCGRVVIAGHVSRPDVLTLRPDFGWLRNMPAVVRLITAGGDNAVLSGVIALFEAQGIKVLAVHDVAPELLALAPSAPQALRDDLEADRCLGFSVLAKLADLDIGQAVVAAQGRVIAIEGVDGTDRMLARLALSNSTDNRQRRGLLIKAPKVGQELRIDMPTIGPQTIQRAADAGLAGVSVAAGAVLVLERAAVDQAAHDLDFIVDVRPPPQAPSPTSRMVNVPSLRQLGRVGPSRADLIDVRKGLDVVSRLASLNTGSATVVVRRHILAVAAEETDLELAIRVAELRQWGSKRSKSARGAFVVRLSSSTDTTPFEALLPHIAKAGLAGLACVHSSERPSPLQSALVAAADAAGLFLIEAHES
jgi:UDP-2,3-diacylglucosamine hydrolase